MRGVAQRLAALAMVGTVATVPAAAEPEGVASSKNGDWQVMTDGAQPPQICFAVSAPKTSEAKGLDRAPAFFYLSTWAKDGIKAEISIKMGFALHKGSEATLMVGDASFKMFANGDRLYVSDPVKELKLLDALKKGSKATLIATSEKGIRSTDTYSLTGLAQALQAVAKLCP